MRTASGIATPTGTWQQAEQPDRQATARGDSGRPRQASISESA